MIEVKTAELYSCIMNEADCTIEEVTDFLNAEIQYWNLEGTVFKDEEGEDTFDSDELYDYLCAYTVFDEDLIREMLDAQYDVVHDNFTLEQKYAAVHNMITYMKENGVQEHEKEFYQGCLEYGASVFDEILKGNHSSEDYYTFLINDMNRCGLFVTEQNYWVRGGC